MDPIIQAFLGLGSAGLLVVLFMRGDIAPKWVVDEYRVRDAHKDVLIERLTLAVERLADAAEGKVVT